jgi:hypothetical protein
MPRSLYVRQPATPYSSPSYLARTMGEVGPSRALGVGDGPATSTARGEGPCSFVHHLLRKISSHNQQYSSTNLLRSVLCQAPGSSSSQNQNSRSPAGNVSLLSQLPTGTGTYSPFTLARIHSFIRYASSQTAKSGLFGSPPENPRITGCRPIRLNRR